MAVSSIVPFVFCSSQQKMDKVFICYERQKISLQLFDSIDSDRNPCFCSELLPERPCSVSLFGWQRTLNRNTSKGLCRECSFSRGGSDEYMYESDSHFAVIGA